MQDRDVIFRNVGFFEGLRGIMSQKTVLVITTASKLQILLQDKSTRRFGVENNMSSISLDTKAIPGRAMAKAVSLQLPTSVARVRVQDK
jgi:hypothetical protein